MRDFRAARFIAGVVLVGFALAGCSGDDGAEGQADDGETSATASPSSSEATEAAPSESAPTVTEEPEPTGLSLPLAVRDGFCDSVDVASASAVLGVTLKKAAAESLDKGVIKCVAENVTAGKATGLILNWSPNDDRPLADLSKSLSASLPACTVRDVPGLSAEQAFQLSCEDDGFRQDSIFMRVGSTGTGSLECRHYTNLAKATLPDPDAAVISCGEQLAAIA